MCGRLAAVVAVFAGCGPGARDVAPDAVPEPGRALRAGYHLPGLISGSWYGDAAIDLASAPDGLVVGGAFFQAGAIRSYPVQWDGEQWLELPGTDAHRIAVADDGTIYAASLYVPCLECGPSEVRRLDGASWVRVEGLDGTFEGLAWTGLGLVAVGSLWGTGQETSVAVLVGATWQHLGTAIPSSTLASVRAVAERDGLLCVGGTFDRIDEVPAANVACLSGGVWSQAGDGLAGEVHSLAFAADGRLIAGGRFTTTGGAHVAVLDASAWSALGGGVDGPDAVVEAIAIDGDAVLVGGSFTTPATSLARFEAGTWTTPPVTIAAFDGPALVSDIVVRPDGVYAAGRFDIAGSVAVAGILRWNAASVAPLIPPGDAPLGVTGEIRALVAHPQGGIIAGGWFVAAGTTAVRNAARLVDGHWEPMGDPEVPIEVLALASDGAVVAGDEAGALLRWSGTAWEPLGPQLGGSIRAITELDGDLIVGGDFTSSGAHVARWNGSSFEAMAAGVPAPVSALGRHAGQLCAGIDFGTGADPRAPTARPLWCWDGSTWAPEATLKGTAVHAITTLPDGSTLLAGVLWNTAEDRAEFVVRFSFYWEGIWVPGTYTARETIVATDERGAYLAVTDHVVWWNGDGTFVRVADGGWTRALLPTAEGVFIGGRGAWAAPDEWTLSGEISAGIAEWR